VDDEQAVCRVLVRALSSMGDVTTCSNGRQALDRLTSGERFELILTDNQMPEMSGPELYEHVAAMWPAQAERVVFLAGSPISHASPASARPFFAKPFDVSLLRAQLATLLAGWGDFEAPPP